MAVADKGVCDKGMYKGIRFMSTGLADWQGEYKIKSFISGVFFLNRKIFICLMQIVFNFLCFGEGDA